jgi:hypothetical protein
MAAIVFPWVSVAILTLTAVGISWRSRKHEWVDDVQRGLNAQPRLNTILEAFLVLFAAVLVFLGVALLASGLSSAWGFFPLALDALFIVGFLTWIARRPFPPR